jgi:hypothetical protein
VRHFTLAVPITSDVEESIAALRLTGPEGEVRMARNVAAPQALSSGRATAVRARDGGVDVACNDAMSRGVLILDAETGSALGSASAASLRATAGAGRTLTVLCSDGVRTTRSNVAAPN